MTRSDWQHGPVEIPIADAALCAAATREIYAQRPRWRPAS